MFVGHTLLYGKEWAWLMVLALSKGELDTEHWKKWALQRRDDPPDKCVMFARASATGDSSGEDTGDSDSAFTVEVDGIPPKL